MELTKDQLDNLVVRFGRVLVRLKELSITKTTSGLDVVAYSDDSKIAFAARKGIVVRAHSDTDIPSDNYFFDGDCEIKEGDEVWWLKNSIAQSMGENIHEQRIFKCEGMYYAVVNYKHLYVKRDSQGLTGLNDHVIVRPIVAEKKSSVLDLSMCAVSKPRRDLLEVVAVPSFEGGYNKRLCNERVVRCSVGDKVFLRSNGKGLHQIEDEINRTLGEDLYAVSSYNIMEIR